MGGRGTFAAGNNIAHTYDTVGDIEGVKVLQGREGKKGLPVEARSSNAYIQLHPDGTFKMYREFDRNHYLVKEIAYHRELKLSGSSKPILHVHEYKPGDFSGRTTRLLTEAEHEKYNKYFVGVK